MDPNASSGSGGKAAMAGNAGGAQRDVEYGQARDPRRFGPWGQTNPAKMQIRVQGVDGMLTVIPDGFDLGISVSSKFCQL